MVCSGGVRGREADEVGGVMHGGCAAADGVAARARRVVRREGSPRGTPARGKPWSASERAAWVSQRATGRRVSCATGGCCYGGAVVCRAGRGLLALRPQAGAC